MALIRCGSACGLPHGTTGRVSLPAATAGRRRRGRLLGAGLAGRGLRERPLGLFKPVDLLVQRGDALVDAFGEFGGRHQLTANEWRCRRLDDNAYCSPRERDDRRIDRENRGAEKQASTVHRSRRSAPFAHAPGCPPNHARRRRPNPTEHARRRSGRSNRTTTVLTSWTVTTATSPLRSPGPRWRER